MNQAEISIKLSQADLDALSLTENEYRIKSQEFIKSKSISSSSDSITNKSFASARSNVSRQGEFVFSGTGR